MMKVAFSDCLAKVKSFSFEYTYAGCMEGTRATCSAHILRDLSEDQKQYGGGFLVIPSWQNDAQTELADCHFELYVETDFEHDLTVHWFGEAPDGTEFLKELIETITKSIDFNKNCRYIDLDNF